MTLYGLNILNNVSTTLPEIRKKAAVKVSLVYSQVTSNRKYKRIMIRIVTV